LLSHIRACGSCEPHALGGSNPHFSVTAGQAMKIRSFHPEFSARPHPYRKTGTRSSGRDAAMPKPASIVPGDGNALSSRGPSALLRGQQLGSRILTIHLRDDPGTAYQIKESDGKTPQMLYRKDPQTDALVSTGDYVQKGDGDEWTKVESPPRAKSGNSSAVTPVTVPGDPKNCFITKPGNTTSQQQVYTREGGILKPFKMGIYHEDAHEVTLIDGGLPGGAKKPKLWRTWDDPDTNDAGHSSSSSEGESSAAAVENAAPQKTKAEQVAEAQSSVDKASDELRKKLDDKINAAAIVKNLEGKIGESRLDFESKQAAEIQRMEKKYKAREALNGTKKTLAETTEALRLAEQGGNEAAIKTARDAVDIAKEANETAKEAVAAADDAAAHARNATYAVKQVLDAQQVELAQLYADTKVVETNYDEAYKNVQALTQKLNALKKS
jgi:hypothetical protein